MAARVGVSRVEGCKLVMARVPGKRSFEDKRRRVVLTWKNTGLGFRTGQNF